MEAKFDFFEVVKVLKSVACKEEKLRKLTDLTGVVKGRSQNDDGTWGYGVLLEATKTVWCFEEDELESTGKFVPENFNKSGETIKVIVNDKGEGEIKED